MWSSYVHLVIFHANEKLIRVKLVLMQRWVAAWLGCWLHKTFHCTRCCLFLAFSLHPFLAISLHPFMHSPSHQMQVEWLFWIRSSHKYSRHSHQQQKGLSYEHLPGKVEKDFSLAHWHLLSIQSTEPRCFEPASGEVRPPNKITRSSVLEMVWFCFLQR